MLYLPNILNFAMNKQLLTTLFFFLFSLSLHAQWTRYDGPEGGSIQDLCTNSSHIYALSLSYIYESSDDGAHWVALPETEGIGARFAKIEVTSSTMYALEPDSALLYRSTDRGATWSYILGRSFPKFFFGQEIVNFMVEGEVVLVATQYAMYRSTDKGSTWAETGDFFTLGTKEFFQYNNEWFVWSGNAVYRSSDEGLTWVKAYFTAHDFETVGVASSGIYALYSDKRTLVHSTDGLRTWSTQFSNLGLSAAFQYKGFVQHKDSLNFVFTTGTSLPVCNSTRFISTNGGLHWYQVPTDEALDLPVSGLKEMLVLPTGRILICSEEGIKYSDDGLATFHWGNTGIHEADPRIFGALNSKVISTTVNGGYLLDPDTGIWTKISTGSTANDCLVAEEYKATENRLFHRNKNETNYYEYSDDDGATWNTLPAVYNTGSTYASKNYFWVGNKMPYRVRNGTDWIEQVSLDIPFGTETVTYFSGRGTLLWGITDQKGLAIFDEETNFIASFPPLLFCPLATSSTLSYFYDGENAWGICGTEVYVFRPSVQQWEEAFWIDWATGVPLYHYKIRDLEVYDGAVLITTSNGIFVNEYGTNRCYPLSPACPEPNLINTKIVGDTLWTVTHNTRELYRLPLSKIPTNNPLLPPFICFPNPSSGALSIQAHQFYSAPFFLDILEPSGRRIRSLVMSPGNEWSFDLNSLPQGLYLLQMHNSQVNTTLKWVKK